MNVYIVHPKLTLDIHPIADRFFQVFEDEVSEHIPYMTFRNAAQLGGRSPITKEDGVVLFNRDDQEYSTAVTTLLVEAKEAGAMLYSVAMSKEKRVSPVMIQDAQSFDVYDNLRRRDLTEANIDTVATALARKVISEMQPTLSLDSMHLFISHRRVDGEEVAAKFSDALLKRSESHFRDVIHVQVGQNAQEVIERHLSQSDAVILLDTPKAGESSWVEKELRLAMYYNLPIIWIKIGTDVGRVKLPFDPVAKPHFLLPEFDLEKEEFNPEFIDAVIHAAFRIIRQSSSAVFDQIDLLKEVARKHGFHLEAVDRKNMIFEVQIPRSGFRYKQRPMTQLIQFFGRSPKETDFQRITPIVCELGYEPHPKVGEVLDSTVMLAPVVTIERTGTSNETCVVDSFSDYLKSLKQLFEPTRQIINEKKKGIIISGAFPDCEPEHQQNLMNALHAFVQAVFEKGGIIIFGAHPTFQHMIFDLGKRLRPNDFKEAIHLYCSKHYVTIPNANELKGKSTVVVTDVVNGKSDEETRKLSLTLMRQKMVGDDEALALIAIGGKTDANGHSPGVDEEISLAKQANIPVFLIGSVGGRTAKLASDYNASEWKNNDLNSLSPEENQEMLVSLDFQLMAEKILSHLGL